MKKLALALVFFAAVAAGRHSAMAATDLERVQKEGKLLVAIDATYPPMESEGDDGKPVGFDIDFANEVAKRLGVKADFVVMNWDGILAGLSSGRYDAIISTMNVTPEREKAADFVEYVRMSQVFVSKKGGVQATSEKDLTGKVVAVQADTTSYDYVEKAKKAGVALKEMKAFKLATDAFAALRAGQADLIVIDEPVARYYVKRDPGFFVITGRALAPEPVGVATKKGDNALHGAMVKAISGMKQDGTLKRLQDKWFGGELGA